MNRATIPKYAPALQQVKTILNTISIKIECILHKIISAI